MIAKSRWFKDN